MHNSASSTENFRGMLVLIALVYTAFVIYGSLVPLDYKALPWDEAVARFKSIPFLQLGIDSRADWVANLLLFIPLSFFWMGAFVAQRSFIARVAITLPLLMAAIALSLGIEFTQLYFPQRTVSQNDIFAETLGAVIGIIAWWLAGERYVTWLQAAKLIHTRAAFTDRLAWVYLAGLFIYNILPLDLTVSAVEIFHKWHEGKVNLMPFGRVPDRFADALYEIGTDALIWTPLALLWCLNRTRSAWRVWWLSLALAGAIEIMQLFVYSRVSDVTDIFTAGIGAALGCAIGRRNAYSPTTQPYPARFSFPKDVVLPVILVSIWMGVLVFVFWFPFDLHSDGSYIKSRLAMVSTVPFQAYYYGTEFRAITELLHKALFAAPLGGLLAWGVRQQPWRWRSLVFAGAMVILVGFPAIIELGQLMLPDKDADITDWLIMWAGGLTGYGVTRRMLRMPHRAILRPENIKQHNPSLSVSHPLRSGQIILQSNILILLSLLFFFAAKASFLPYNVREIMGDQPSWLSAILLALTCGWLINWPIFLAYQDVSGLKQFWQLAWGLLIYGAVSFLLLYFSVSNESLQDLLGSPILQWPGQWEMGVRWLALSAVPGALFYLATQTARRVSGKTLDALQFCAAAPILILSYWGVVVQAATDNLVELMATPRLLSFAAICAWIYTLFLTALWIRALASMKIKFIATLVSLALAYIFLSLGLDNAIQKYDQQFSALQFMLSTDRQHYAPVFIIWLRYSALHILVVMTLAFMQYPRLSLTRASPPGSNAAL